MQSLLRLPSACLIFQAVENFVCGVAGSENCYKLFRKCMPLVVKQDSYMRPTYVISNFLPSNCDSRILLGRMAWTGMRTRVGWN